jgi:hypothetical protein
VKALRIYVAGPYSADAFSEREANVNVAVDTAIALFQMGHFPYVPHLTHFVDIRSHEIGAILHWEDYLRWDEAWLEVCDALIYLAPSPGADKEFQRARSLGKQVFRSMAEVPVVRTVPTSST